MSDISIRIVPMFMTVVALVAVALATMSGCASTPASATVMASAPKYSVASTPLEVLEADPAARAAVVKQFPKIFEHPAYSMFKSMTLEALQPYSQGALSDEGLAALQTDLNGLN